MKVPFTLLINAVSQAGLRYAGGVGMAKAIMVQGTMSSVGKSFLTAGLCRIFKQDGYRVAPFKSQNMALNSYITEEGLEMGRAQVMQAEAAGIIPSVYMNPILLKPTDDTGSQVIVNGKAIGHMRAKEYFLYKKQLVPDIMRAYNRLAAEHDIIVIEGAGSPAEINLKTEDIVNMGMARMAKAPVLLAGDIDRGGVFAQLMGTIMLLTEEEKAMVKGTIINKFRGDPSLLDSGIVMLEEMSKIPVLGVTPYMNISLEDEDSLSERFTQPKKIGLVDIAVIRLPKISNFTDFNIFETMEGVSLHYETSPEKLLGADMIILPGSKNTIEDLKWLRQSGMETGLLKAYHGGTVVFGICGGYQMLGESIADPYSMEGGGTIQGMGLLPVHTVFEKEKHRTQVKGSFTIKEGIFQKLECIPVEGYEIHMGQTKRPEGYPGLLHIPSMEGVYKDQVFGTYVHGVFDNGKAAEVIVKALAGAKGVDWDMGKTMDYKAYKEMQYNKLADQLRDNMDMETIYKIVEEGIK